MAKRNFKAVPTNNPDRQVLMSVETFNSIHDKIWLLRAQVDVLAMFASHDSRLEGLYDGTAELYISGLLDQVDAIQAEYIQAGDAVQEAPHA